MKCCFSFWKIIIHAHITGYYNIGKIFYPLVILISVKVVFELMFKMIRIVIYVSNRKIESIFRAS